MKTLLVDKCAAENLFTLEDPSAPSEEEFTTVVLSALGCVFSKYECVPFVGRFHLEGKRFKPDLALVARDYSHLSSYHSSLRLARRRSRSTDGLTWWAKVSGSGDIALWIGLFGFLYV
jgi:hypothetical protein